MPKRAAESKTDAKPQRAAQSQPAPRTQQQATLDRYFSPATAAARSGPHLAAMVTGQGGPDPGKWQINRMLGQARWVGPGRDAAEEPPLGFREVANSEAEDAQDAGQWIDEARPGSGAATDQDAPGWRVDSGHQTRFVPLPGGGGAPMAGLSTEYRKHGRAVAEKINEGEIDVESAKQFGPEYRMTQLHWPSGFGGTGYDEMFSTSETRKAVAEAKDNNAAEADVTRMLATLSGARELVANLAWVTGAPNAPIGGHPGAITTTPGDMRRGVTTQHNTRDKARSAMVGNELRKSQNLGSATAMAHVMTNQLMSQPYAQLSQLSSADITKKAYHARYGDLSNEKNLHNLMADVHNAREERKARVASWLMNNGYADQVAPETQRAIRAAGSWANAVFNIGMNHHGTHDDGPASSQAYTPGKKAPLETLEEMKANGRVFVSPLRRRIDKTRPKPAGVPAADSQRNETSLPSRGSRKRNQDARSESPVSAPVSGAGRPAPLATQATERSTDRAASPKRMRKGEPPKSSNKRKAEKEAPSTSPAKDRRTDGRDGGGAGGPPVTT